MRSLFLFATLAVLAPATQVGAQPPKILTASPAFWAVNVDPTSQKEISITFDKPMRAGFSSWAGRNSITPELAAAAKISEDLRTYALPVRLRPGKVYVFGLNERGIRGVGFQDEKGITLPPTYLVFQTSGNPSPDEMPPRAISTIPSNGSQQVEPTRLKSIAITFDKQMQTAKHGLHMFENSTAVDLSSAQFHYSSDGRTFTLAYDFKSSTTYEFELNSTRNIGFTSSKRIPLWQTKFGFTTGSAQ